MSEISISAEVEETVRALGDKYLWWEAVTPGGHSLHRMIAQTMRYGTYDDIRRLESVLSTGMLAQAMIASAPGWFDDRRWSFWRGRLAYDGASGIPEERPKRRFTDAAVL
jgi:hypothetical protein